MTDWTKYLGHRVLVSIKGKLAWLPVEIKEVIILELSPSKKYVKLKILPSETIKWTETNDLKILEVLEK